MSNTKGSRSMDVKKKKAAIVEAIKENHGLVMKSCKEVGMHHSTFYSWMEKDPEFKDKAMEAVDYGRENMKDIAESSLFSKIRQEDNTATIFYLKTKARDRGYVDRTEVTGKDGEPLFAREQVSKIAKELAGEDENK